MRNRFLLLQRNFHVSSISSLNKTFSKNEFFDTGVRIYDCVTKKKIPLQIRSKYLATWYTCGPTVYDSTHIGHASCYVKLDIIQRILRDYLNINLITSMNITDIDDKIIQKSQQQNINWKIISQQYEQEFWNDLKSLQIIEPNIKIRVTENISEIIKFIQKLLDQKQAYIASDKSVYFDTSKYINYGKLQKINISDDNCSSSIEHNNHKYSNLDFALWKAQKNEYEPTWPTSWDNFNGRPGWHIECSTLCTKLFGNSVDFHAGGIDLKFPHHENEEAQSCSYHNTSQWVINWIHTGHLNIKGHQEKMSKSLKNTISIDELLKLYSPNEFRMACALSNYRNSMEYCDETMLTARHTFHKFLSFKSDCKAYLDGKKQGSMDEIHDMLISLRNIEELIDKSIKDDFNTAKCIGYLLELASSVSKFINSSSGNTDENSYTSQSISAVVAANNLITKFMNILGFNYTDENLIKLKAELKDNNQQSIDDMLEIRNQLRKIAISTKNKDLYEICDQIRQNLRTKSIEIKDHNKGSSWNYVSE